ncbi:MAG: rhomboid family intramembrane serine protease [Geobacteraceae bacterium]|nr:rhomboid family intramembrane serine protease [Geobacteraceae bacterium]
MIFAIIVAVIAALVTASAELSSLASLDSSRVMAGEFWRLFSGHAAHLSWRQYAMDAPVFILLYATYSRRVAPSSAMFLSLFAALSVSLAVILAGMHQVYGGLSGLSCAAVSAILVAMIMEQPRRTFPCLMGLVFCVYLLFMGGFASGVGVAHEAHVAGAASGLVFALIRVRASGSLRKGLPLT